MQTNPCQDAVAIWHAAMDSVRAKTLVRRFLRVESDQLLLGSSSLKISEFERVIVVGAGKAGSAMAKGLVDQIGTYLPLVGWINVPDGTQLSLPGITTHPARPAGRNEPTEAGVHGTRKIIELVNSAGPRDLCIALISGGGSALLPAPNADISLTDKLEVTRFLSSAGADIVELNTVRKHLSEIKGGGLLRAFKGRRLLTLILSDVLGDPIDQIASGPTVPDTTQPVDALRILKKYDPNEQLSISIYQSIENRIKSCEAVELESTGTSKSMSTAKEPVNSDINQDPLTEEALTFVIGNNAYAVSNAKRTAMDLGYATQCESATESEGTAEEVGRDLAEMAIKSLEKSEGWNRKDLSADQPTLNVTGRKTAFISGGEPTVVLCDESLRGCGGRNQQLVLAAYQRLREHQLSPGEWSKVCILSGGTDGEDGPTDAAGAFLNAKVHQLAMELELDPLDFLLRNDAYHFFQQTGGLLMTGPTGTNVCDVRVVTISEQG
ncbi:MAG: DUF4147 domain-containing protein [Planctomycetota bacterium]|nr:DUF4147 domain-containing protein [Planctomycetota bacterium]